MPISLCFGYPADVPLGAMQRAHGQAALRGLRKMPQTCYSFPLICFSYPGDMSPASPDRDAVPIAPPGLRRMPLSCFHYRD